MQQGVGPEVFDQYHLARELPGAVGQVQVFGPDAEHELAQAQVAGRGPHRGGQRDNCPPSRAPPSVSGTVCRFIAGEPMNPATNWFTGL